MKIILAQIFRLLFKLKFFKKRYFGIYKKLFKPYNLFKGVIRKTRYGKVVLMLHIDDWIQQHLYFLGEYEKAELKAIEQFVPGDGVFIDIGANIGLYTLYVSELINKAGQIICFEPFSINFNSLTENIALNNLGNVRTEKIAVSDSAGVVNLYYNGQDNNLGMVSSKPLAGGVTEQVKTTSLDTYLLNNPVTKIDLIKIDVEGFEYAALLGMKNTLAAFKPVLLIEILNDDSEMNGYSNCHTLLQSLGYTKYYIDDDGTLCENETNISRMNYIFIKHSNAEK